MLPVIGHEGTSLVSRGGHNRLWHPSDTRPWGVPASSTWRRSSRSRC